MAIGTTKTCRATAARLLELPLPPCPITRWPDARELLAQIEASYPAAGERCWRIFLATIIDEGLERSRRANWKHGHFSREAKAERSRLRAAILVLRYLRGTFDKYNTMAVPKHRAKTVQRCTS